MGKKHTHVLVNAVGTRPQANKKGTYQWVFHEVSIH